MRQLATFMLALSSAALLADLGQSGTTPPPSADAARGREIYGRCQACHSLETDRVGPRHCGLFERPAGSVPGFVYSEAMRESGIVWNRITLDRFLADPLGTVPGTFMGYAGVSDPQERAQLLDYLEIATRAEQCDSDSEATRQ